MNTKAQDTVHAKYYKQQIDSGTKYKLQKEALEQRGEILEYCNRVLSSETVEELTEVIIQELVKQNSISSHKQFIIEHDMI